MHNQPFLLWGFADLLPLHTSSRPPTHPLFVFSSPSDADDSGLVDVYDYQRHVRVPGIQPGAPVT